MNRKRQEIIHFLAAPDHDLAGAVCSPSSRARKLKLGEYSVTRELPLVTCGACLRHIKLALGRVKTQKAKEQARAAV